VPVAAQASNSYSNKFCDLLIGIELGIEIGVEMISTVGICSALGY
jgi:hypothetical protein